MTRERAAEDVNNKIEDLKAGIKWINDCLKDDGDKKIREVMSRFAIQPEERLFSVSLSGIANKAVYDANIAIKFVVTDALKKIDDSEEKRIKLTSPQQDEIIKEAREELEDLSKKYKIQLLVGEMKKTYVSEGGSSYTADQIFGKDNNLKTDLQKIKTTLESGGGFLAFFQKPPKEANETLAAHREELEEMLHPTTQKAAPRPS